MAEPKFTTEQQAAIDAAGKTIVSASAGSGKTTVMIEKMLGLIRSGVDVSEILAVTYTKKAAAQMKEKLRKKILKALAEPNLKREEREWLKKTTARCARCGRFYHSLVLFQTHQNAFLRSGRRE